ncbi:hypothetical protein CEE69_05350 [Rhodopirellula bahusiensis]|uniref:Uncharacterized protein n=1 Tax=Rhodopirellula bahusiensis TaxID=2014065 RepID=A0A2G1WAS0_9BACT|nr:hypothetical protein CEE69_05350 [Rhodopirellula bahusiensis]
MPHNGRFLRHRPERSGRCLNCRKLYQGYGPLPKSQGVPEGPQRKNHVRRQTRERVSVCSCRDPQSRPSTKEYPKNRCW